MLNNALKFIPSDARIAAVFFLCCVWILFSGCALISNPEKSGGEILAVPDGSWCSFSISGDGRWLQYMGDESPLLKSDAQNSSHQRQTFLIDLESGEKYFAEPDSEVQQYITEGYGPDGLGCFSPDHTRLYFTTVDWSNSSQREESGGQVQNGRTPSAGFSTSPRQRNRYHYSVDLTTKPLVIRKADQATCAETPDPVRPDIRIERPSDKRIVLYANDGRSIASHRPRGLFGNSISIWDPDHHQWWMDYSLSPDGNYLAYRISERGLIGFSAPTRGYLVNLSPDERPDNVFLAASVYSMEWDHMGNFYACTSHRNYRRVIARWSRPVRD